MPGKSKTKKTLNPAKTTGGLKPGKQGEGGGAPTKMTKKLIGKFEQILDDKNNALLFTDEELLEILNEELDKEEKISLTTWKDWSGGKKIPKSKRELFEKFSALIKKARRIQKQNLFKKLSKSSSFWQRWAWILERKFDDFNLRKLMEVKNNKNVFDLIRELKREAEKSRKPRK